LKIKYFGSIVKKESALLLRRGNDLVKEDVIMTKSLIYWVSLVLLLGPTEGMPNTVPLQQDPGPDGIVSVEAENFDRNTPMPSHTWELITVVEGGFAPPGGFSGGVAMLATPGGSDGRGNINAGYPTGSPRLDYEVNFKKTGTHYIWILGWCSDSYANSIHSGLNGEEIATANNIGLAIGTYEWTSTSWNDATRRSFEVTSLGIHTLNIWMREDGAVVDKILLTTNPDYTPIGNGPSESPRESDLAYKPVPDNRATDVTPAAMLSWAPAVNADKYDVYLDPNFHDVDGADRTNPLGVLVSQDQEPNNYSPAELLQFVKTYYWRVDGVNDSTILKGDIWSFTVEPVAYPIAGENITATASSYNSADEQPENTINGSGLDDDDLHSAENGDMWLSSTIGPHPTWIQYEFDKVYKLHEMSVWNHNSRLELHIGLGIKEATIDYSVDGTNWTTWGTEEFNQATGMTGYEANTTVDLSGVVAKYVRITVNSKWDNILPQSGLSEVRFLYIPVWPREPQPADGAALDSVDVTLGWRAGREAETHQVALGTDPNALLIVDTVATNRYEVVALDMDTEYAWLITEINEAETPSAHTGPVWTFRTPEFLVVDDMESYDNEENLPWLAWADGYDVAGNGSEVGANPLVNDYGPETDIVNGGRQSLPIWFDNTIEPLSEATRTFDPPQDWARSGIQTLVLYFVRWVDNTGHGRLYVKINDAQVFYEQPAVAPQTWDVWAQWNIDLTGMDVSSVTSLTIGVEGGTHGVLYVDDIRLYAEAPAIPEFIWIEAEAGVITGTKYEVKTVEGASGGLALNAWDEGSSSDADDNKASYTIQSTGGTYRMEVRFYAPNALANSCFVRMPGVQDNWVVWHTPFGDSWKWGILAELFEIEMPAGNYTLEIAPRERECHIDAIMFTKVSE